MTQDFPITWFAFLESRQPPNVTVNYQVLAAQTRLAQELHERSELYEIYLVELLTLFSDKGVAIQNVAISNHHVKVSSYGGRFGGAHFPSQTEDMVEQLASLLLPIDALLAHEDFNPHVSTSTGIVPLFRNMWFLCVLFHFTWSEDKGESAMGWRKPALARIASKTPSMVLEEAHDGVASEVEYNSVLRQEYANTVRVLLPFTIRSLNHYLRSSRNTEQL
jgi:phosphatidylinositol 4-kinase